MSPLETALRAGLILIDETAIVLANGQEHHELVFGAEVEFLGMRREVAVFVFDRDYPLIGTGLLSDCQLIVDFPTTKVNVFRNGPRK